MLVTYHHSVDIPPGNQADTLGERIRWGALPVICTDDGLRLIMREGFGLSYAYRTTTGSHVPGFLVRLGDCG